MRHFFVLYVCIVLLSSPTMAADVQNSLLDVKVSSFTSNAQIEQAVSDLASSLGGLMAGEAVHKTSTDPSTGASEAPGPVISVSVRDMTVRDILDLLIAKDSRYCYVVSGDWINLVPKNAATDPNYVYNRHIPGKVVVSTDSTKDTSIKAWAEENRVSSMLLTMGDMRRSLPTATQTVTLVNPTFREYTNARMRLSGKNRWFGDCRPRKDGGTLIVFHYSVVKPD